ncbi:MAG: hypothetical protein AMJ93_09880 [Anaerolineae bacterium SM23_84]|nr:MAG: hypothetical protein AMJ93_09880 [Anaerolineae bacterium SM23_84]
MAIRLALAATAVIALALLAGCGGGEPTPLATPAPTDTPVPQDLSISVPRGTAPVLDGTLSPDEWPVAYQADLTPSGRLMLLHDGQYLYLGIRGSTDSVGSVCVASGDVISVLHSSLGLGTAAYEHVEEGWQRIRSFSFTWWDTSDSTKAHQQQAEFLLAERWLASTIGTGSPGEMEYQLALPEGPLRLAVTYFTGDGTYEKIVRWPEQLDDACMNTSLIQGRAPRMIGFHPEQWVAIRPVASR